MKTVNGENTLLLLLNATKEQINFQFPTFNFQMYFGGKFTWNAILWDSLVPN